MFNPCDMCEILTFFINCLIYIYMYIYNTNKEILHIYSHIFSWSVLEDYFIY